MSKFFINFYRSQDKLVFYCICFTLLVSILITIALLLTYSALPKKLPLFYSLPWGASQLVSTPQLILLPALIILVTLVNLTISWQLHPSQLPLKRILNLSSALFALLIFTTTIKIILIFL